MDKSNFTKYFLGLFLLELGLEFFHIQWAIFIVKPAVTSLIIFYFYKQSRSSVSVFSQSILFGSIASLGGDIFLMFPRFNPNFFLVGLVSFLIAHLFYIRAYLHNIRQSEHTNSFSVKLMVSNPIVLMSLAMYSLMKNDLGEMKIPVLFYMTAITCMGVMAGLRINHTTSGSWKKVLGGAILFLLSDSIIALNKFVQPFEYSNLAIMSTYYVAQFFIATGCLEHLERNEGVTE